MVQALLTKLENGCYQYKFTTVLIEGMAHSFCGNPYF